MRDGQFVAKAEDPAGPGGWQAGPWGRCRRLVATGQRGGQGYGRRSCTRPSVASCLRGGRSRVQRWGYCALHLASYGRVVRDTAVWWDPDRAKAVLQSYGETRTW
jgi:hypothetical protein